MSELKSRDPRACPECGGHSMYQAATSSGGHHGPCLLPGLGGFLSFAQLNVVVCADCGLARFYAEREARTKLRTSARWTQL